MKTTLIKILTAIALFFAPIKGLMIAVALVIILDTITGVIKVFRTKQKFHSRGLSSVISKMVLYQSAIIFLYPIDHYLLNDLIMLHFSTTYLFTKLCAVVLILVELTSIKENIEESLGVNLWKILKGILMRAKEVKEDINELKD